MVHRPNGWIGRRVSLSLVRIQYAQYTKHQYSHYT
nr:MAG TPA: hypothetical protein [Caudoviricetes sp.]